MATRIESPSPMGGKEVFYVINGLKFSEKVVQYMMPAKDLDLQLKWVKETEIRDDDVIICAYPKTGTHWTWEIVNMIRQGTSEYHKDAKEAAMLEHCTQEMTSSMASPRVLNTHFTYDFLPDGMKEKKCKIVHVMRNPKDVVVSLYHHTKQMPGAPNIPFEKFSKKFRGALGQPPMCSYLWYVKQWEQTQKHQPHHPILNVYYEDLKKEPEVEIKRIAKFLGKDIDEALVAEISDKCNFQNLKQAHENKNDVMKDRMKNGTQFLYRKGITGDWKNYFTVAESEEYDRWIESELEESSIKFKYQ